MSRADLTTGEDVKAALGDSVTLYEADLLASAIREYATPDCICPVDVPWPMPCPIHDTPTPPTDGAA